MPKFITASVFYIDILSPFNSFQNYFQISNY